MSKPLPARASLRQLQVQAKELAGALKSGDTGAIARFAKAVGRQPGRPAKLNDAQLAIAREYGFESWAALKNQVLAREGRAVEVLQSELRRVVNDGDVAGFRVLLSAHPELKSGLDGPLFDFGTPAIRRAAERKDLAMVDALIEAGANINQRSHWEPGGFGVLDGADRETAAQLIARGAVVDIHAAAHLGDVRRIRELLDASPGLVNARGGDGASPLHFAADLDTVNLLLERGADVRLRDLDHGSTAAMWQVRNRDILHRLIEAGSPIDIYMACVHGDRDLADRALREDPGCLGAYVSHDRGDGRFAPDTGGNHYNWTIGHTARPIPVAARFGHPSLVRHLLDRARPAERLVALCFLGDSEGIRQLLSENPGLPGALDASSSRALPDAIHFQDIPAAERMIHAGFPLTGRGVNGGTALHVASWFGEAGLVAELLRRGASLEDRDNTYKSTPLHWACHGSLHCHADGKRDHAGVVKTLLESGADFAFVADAFQKGDEAIAAPAVVEVLKARLNPPVK
jgi:ankyrin repeat protein